MDLIPPHVWNMVVQEHQRQHAEREALREAKGQPAGTEVPQYALCRFCGTQTPINWLPPAVEGEEFTVKVVDICPTCEGFRKAGPVFANIDELIRRAVRTHVIWHHQGDDHAHA